jgi:hypothetical protein
LPKDAPKRRRISFVVLRRRWSTDKGHLEHTFEVGWFDGTGGLAQMAAARAAEECEFVLGEFFMRFMDWRVLFI